MLVIIQVAAAAIVTSPVPSAIGHSAGSVRIGAGRLAVGDARRTAMISAAMLTAISAGVTAPMSSPIGAWTCASRSGGTPARSSSSKMRDDLPLRPDQPEVPSRRPDHRRQRLPVAAVAAGDDDDIGLLVDRVLRKFGVDRAHAAVRAGEPSGDAKSARSSITVTSKSSWAAIVAERRADVSRARDHQRRPRRQGTLEPRRPAGFVRYFYDESGDLSCGQRIAGLPQRRRPPGAIDDLDRHVHIAAAEQAVVPAEVVIEPEGEEPARVSLRTPVREQPQRPRADLRLDAPAADRPQRPAVGQHDQHRPLLLRRAAARAHDRADGQGLPGVAAADDLVEEVEHAGMARALFVRPKPGEKLVIPTELRSEGSRAAVMRSVSPPEIPSSEACSG